ncbi:S8 family serine peptidase [Fulvivirga sp. 29W222]|uniref:S8 family serine peptidase n=1 Tax=Fulvivirga marina TaxID=2494733 RepID=A0A937KE18_9BACT|nr:S8 family serine peptidase [Fulvivirga marina]MBL6446778.1 S8 family serine peptidase [Fulvivirga marina]
MISANLLIIYGKYYKSHFTPALFSGYMVKSFTHLIHGFNYFFGVQSVQKSVQQIQSVFSRKDISYICFLVKDNMKGNIHIPLFIVAVLLLELSFVGGNVAVAQAPDAMVKQVYADDQLIVKFNSDIAISRQQTGGITIDNPQIRDLNRQLNVINAETLIPNNKAGGSNGSASSRPPVSQQPVLYTFGDQINVNEVIHILMKTGFYEYAEPNYMGYGGSECTVTPDDAHYNNRQWGLHNDGTLTATSVEGADIDMEKAWGITTGDTSVVVAILDSGIKLDHPEFDGRVWVNTGEIAGNLLDDDGNGYYNDIHGWDFVNNDNDPVDDHGHGTNLAGIIGATGNNEIGYAGVDWKSKLMACKVLDENNSGFYSNWISAIYYAVDNGADVINMSVGGINFSAAMRDAVDYARSHGVPVVASMMNINSEKVFYPAGYESVIAVGATNPDHTRASPFFYDAASGSNFGDHIDIVAPGNYIYGLNYKGNNDYNRMWGGTSQAVPFVVGVISLIKGMNEDISVDSIKSILYNTAMDGVGRPNEDIAGWDKYHGHGVLNAYQALSKLAVTFIDQFICSGEDYTFPDGVVLTSIIENVKHTSMLLSQNNCDSVVVTSLKVTPVYNQLQEISLCSGEDFTFPDGTVVSGISEALTHVSQLSAASGCDSLVTTVVSINSVYDFEEEVSVCRGEDYTFPDGTKKENITGDISFISMLKTISGCDSVITTNVRVNVIDLAIEVSEHTLICNTQGADYQWINCANGGLAIEGEINLTFEPSQAGSYAVIVTKGGCEVRSECLEVTPLGVGGLEQRFVKVYPNPTCGELNIETNLLGANFSVEVTDLSGRVIDVPISFKSSMLKINIDQPAGIYLLNVYKDSDVAIFKVIKEL